MRDIACSECVVTSLLGPIDLAKDGQALDVLAQAGLVAPLRLTVVSDPAKDWPRATG